MALFIGDMVMRVGKRCPARSVSSVPGKIDEDNCREAEPAQRTRITQDSTGLKPWLVMLGAAFGFVIASATAKADSVFDFYKGRQLTFVVGSPPGTAYDVYARAIARHISQFIPGSPNPVLQNMPGAGSLVAANYVANVAVRDGSVIAAINSAVPFQKLFGVTAVRFDAPKMNWLPSPSGFSAVLLVSDSAPAQSFAELREKETLIATLSPGATPSFFAALFNNVFGTKLKPVTGHPSMPAALLAMQRGEVHGFPSTPWTSLKRNYSDLLAAKKLTILLQFGPSRIAEISDVPFAHDLAKADEDRRLLDIAMAPLVIGFPYMMAREVPSERVVAVRKAMIDVMNHSRFKQEAGKLTLEISPVSGEEVQRVVESAYTAPQDVLARIRRIYDSQSR